MLKIIDLLLEVSGKVAADYQLLADGHVQMPSAKELVTQCYELLILPVIERVIGVSFGFLSTPILWAYRSTLGRAVRFVIRLIPANELEAATGIAISEASIANEVRESMAQIAKQERSIVQRLGDARSTVQGVGGWFRLLVLLPCYTVFGTIITLLRFHLRS